MADDMIRELMLRGDVARCLIVAPGSLVEQWHDVQVVIDMKSEFYLNGTTIDFNDGLMDRGFTFLKMDIGIWIAAAVKDGVVGHKPMEEVANTMHPFTGIQVTEKGIEAIVEYVKDAILA